MVLQRKLTAEELQELEEIKRSKLALAAADRRKFLGTADDLSGLLAPYYMKKAFSFGWDEAIAESQGTANHTSDPSNNIYKISAGLGVVGLGGFFALCSIPGALAVPVAAPAIIIGAFLVGALLGGVGGLISAYFDTQKVKGARDFGRTQASEAISKVIEKSTQRDLDRKQSEGIAKQREESVKQQEKIATLEAKLEAILNNPEKSMTEKYALRVGENAPQVAGR